jgi:hypothetical protein
MKVKSPITLFAVAFVLHAQTDWPVYGHDTGGNRYSPLKQITPKNVAKLQLAWSYDTQAPINLPSPSTAAAPGSRPVGAGPAGRGPERSQAQSVREINSLSRLI